MRNLVFLSVMLLAGCSSHTAMHFGPGSSGTTGMSANVRLHTGPAFAAAIGLGFVVGIAHAEAGEVRRAAPDLDPTRSVQERDCRQPISDFSANLRCR